MISNRYGFNIQWMYSYDYQNTPREPDEKILDFISEKGFNTIRLPLDYRFWINNHRYFDPVEEPFSYIDSYLEECQKRDLHLIINLHRAPGYCINKNEIEIDNLWLDKIARDAFVFQWQYISERYKDVASDELSFDLLNEPPSIGEYGMTRNNHEELIRNTVAAIRAIDKKRTIIIDGLCGGNKVLPEVSDLDVIQSTRGYQPMALTHYKASWWEPEQQVPQPVYPGLEWKGKIWDKQTIKKFYLPWLELEENEVEIFVGEFGCYNKIENEIALKWFGDILALFEEFNWGFLLWNFQGPFGIADHGRPGTEYKKIDGFKIDYKLLELLVEFQS